MLKILNVATPTLEENHQTGNNTLMTQEIGIISS